jgi:hypothetical protein
MQFPKAQGEDAEHGWKIDVDFLKRIKSASSTFYDDCDMDIEEIQSVLLAVTVWQSLNK